MLKRWGRRWLQSFSHRYQYDTTYMEELLEHSPTTFLKFSTLHLLSTHRRTIPVAAWHAARIRASVREDCGPCVQLVCNMALEAGLISLALTISTTRVYPSMKYVRGHGHACSRVQVHHRSVAPARFASATLGATAIAASVQ